MGDLFNNIIYKVIAVVIIVFLALCLILFAIKVSKDFNDVTKSTRNESIK